jgi:hypothetical protein
VSVPLQFNGEQNVGPTDQTRFVLNVQPVMPFTVNEKMNLINVLVAKLATFGPFPASYQVGFGIFPVHPDVGPTSKLRAAIVLLFPRARR